MSPDVSCTHWSHLLATCDTAPSGYNKAQSPSRASGIPAERTHPLRLDRCPGHQRAAGIPLCSCPASSIALIHALSGVGSSPPRLFLGRDTLIVLLKPKRILPPWNFLAQRANQRHTRIPWLDNRRLIPWLDNRRLILGSTTAVSSSALKLLLFETQFSTHPGSTTAVSSSALKLLLFETQLSTHPGSTIAVSSSPCVPRPSLTVRKFQVIR